MFDTVLTAFALGNAAILTNACMLPLYPGLLAFMASGVETRSRRATALLGVLVFVGILSAMLVIGLILASIAGLLRVILPIVYGAVILLGILMLIGRNPFARLAVGTSPMLRSPYISAYLYGVLFGPMTLPCTAPVIATAFLYGAGTFDGLVDGVVYFLAFGVGFGYPLMLLPLFAASFQRQMVRFLARHNQALSRASGVLMIAIGIFGIVTELLPQWLTADPSHRLHELITNQSAWAVYWLTVALLIVGVVLISHRRPSPPDSGRRVQES
jgi:cytochrome c-type biogenesis protein